MDQNELAERYARGLRKRFFVLKAVPWSLLIKIALLLIQYFMLDAQRGHVEGFRMGEDGWLAVLPTQGIPDDVVKSWRELDA